MILILDYPFTWYNQYIQTSVSLAQIAVYRTKLKKYIQAEVSPMEEKRLPDTDKIICLSGTIFLCK